MPLRLLNGNYPDLYTNLLAFLSAKALGDMKKTEKDRDNSPQKADQLFANRIVKVIFGSQDPFTSIIKGHLLVEAFLSAIIEGAFIRPDVLNVDRMSYHAKIRLCIGSGLLHEEVMPVLDRLGKLRNRFAHDLWHSIERTHEADFIKAVKKFKATRNRLTKGKSIKAANSIQDAIYVLCMYLFEQAVRTAASKESLYEFWTKTIDYSGIQVSPVTITKIIGPMTEREIESLFGRSELEKIRNCLSKNENCDK